MMRAKRSTADGFTLVEVLVALLVVMAVIVPLFAIFRSGLQTAGSAEAATRAALWAESLIDGIGRGEKLEDGELSGKTADGYRWHAAVRRYAADGTNPSRVAAHPYEIALVVSWREFGRERAIGLSTLRLVPGR